MHSTTRTIYALFATCLAGACPMNAADPEPGKQVEQTLTRADGGSIGYLLYLPRNYEETTEALPLMLFLHGRGESYGPLSLVKKWGPPRLVERGDDAPYVLVSPQCPGESSWNRPEQQAGLIELLDHMIKTYRVDEDRIVLTGLSMGGYGSWRLAADHPERFAAVAPICGGGDPADAEKLKNLPIWVFHGTADGAVPFQRSVDMVEAIKKVGGERIRFTSLEEVGHNSWSAAYATSDLFSWFAKQRASNNHATP